MSYGADHDHRGEYADTRHDHDGDYAEKYHHHRDYADEIHTHDPDYADKAHEHDDIVSDYRETIEALRGQLVTREAVAAMLDAFRLDMREHFSGNADELAQIKTGLVTRLEALRDRVSAVEDALAALEVVIAPRLDRLEAALDALDGDQDQAPELGRSAAPELGHSAALAAALIRDATAATAVADVPPDTCPGDC